MQKCSQTWYVQKANFTLEIMCGLHLSMGERMRLRHCVVDCIDIQHKIPEELKLSQGFRVVNQACIMYLMRTYPHIDPAVYTETVGHHVRSRRVIETFRTKESDGYN